MRPQAGDPAPDFELQTDEGTSVRLADFLGKRVVLFFYPRADTPGCIKEACGFRDDYIAFQGQDVVVLGISPDTVRAQQRFRERYSFPYPLLADADHRVAEAYGVWEGKQLFGITYKGVVRTTFLIDELGKIMRVYEGVVPEGHSQEILAELQLARPQLPTGS
jgi:peroxiredoxin Q/BCP